MIVVTGSAGFIGSVVAQRIGGLNPQILILVDDFDRKDKANNHIKLSQATLIHRDAFTEWFQLNHQLVDFVVHLGARTDTTEFDQSVFDKLNLNYSKAIWNACAMYGIPLIYASSAATYGLGEYGYIDDHEVVGKLKPLNPYGISKNDFDKWALEQKIQPPFWAGLKFFNVYGPNEFHKGRMASVIFHAYHQIINTGKVKLFRSHRPDFEDGRQLRDFVYVKDVAEVISFLMEAKPASGLYNLGTGQARSFLDLALGTFGALSLAPVIEFVDTPADIRDKYQYFTEADMRKLHAAGYHKPFTSLEEGIADYVKQYLSPEKYF